MNNKGFAITTMLYGTFLIFLMLMLAMLSILNTYKENMDRLIDGNNGARKIVELKCNDDLGEPIIDKGEFQYKFVNRKNKSLSEGQFANVVALCGGVVVH